MADLASFKATIYGKVQGIGFRYFTSRYASRLSLTGYVTNLPGGKSVEVEAEGERDLLKKLIEYLEAGTTGSRVEKVDIDWEEHSGRYSSFSIKY